jgi:outer membrane autotransporter protein
LALKVRGQDVDSLTTALGGQVSYAISTALGVLLPQLRVEWEHEFLNDSRTIRATFVEDPTDAQREIQVRTDAPDRDYCNLGAGLSMTFRGGTSAFAYYETVLGLADVTIHNFTLGVRVEL